MPVSIVVGGQFGSEGKGKVSLDLVRTAKESDVTVVRVGGTNSGHTGYDRTGKKFALRQLPAACIDQNVDVVFPSGSYIDVNLLFEEISILNYPTERIFISEYARIITNQHRDWETGGKLIQAIGSTGSGVGAAVMSSIAREARNFPLTSILANEVNKLKPFWQDTTNYLRAKLASGGRVIIEGSQGFGLSLLDGGYWPKATSRCTTAAAALNEAGLSPLDVDKIYLVLRSYPIRVAGNSGKLVGELTWDEVAKRGGIELDLSEYTTVTKKLRRVGEFDAEQVRRAIYANNPTHIVMNHLDYIGTKSDLNTDSKLSRFLSKVECDLKRKIDLMGFNPFDLIEKPVVAI